MGNAGLWLRFFAWAVLVLCCLGGLAYGGVYLVTERQMAVPPMLMAAPVRLPAGDAAEGERLSRVLGCRGCHGSDLGGRIFFEMPHVARLVAPNLTQLRQRYSDETFVRLMRSGAKADGRLALVMPSRAFQRLRDQQLAHVLAYLRSVPVVARELPDTRIQLLARIGMLTGKYDLENFRADPPESPGVLADRHEADAGRHLALVACSECHGMDLAGFPQEGTPGLVVAKAYDDVEFARLMREGITKAGGESASGMMSGVARDRFSALTDQELAALKAFLDRR